MIDVIPEWISQNGHQRQQNNGYHIPEMHTGLSPTDSLMEREDIFGLVMNGLLFGENEYENELIQQEMLPEILCTEFVEYPFLAPPDEDIYGPINLGICEATGVPAGIFPHEVHTLSLIHI